MNGDAPLLQRAQAFLAQFSQAEDRWIGALLASPDGLLVAHHLPLSDHLEKIAAMSTALYALGKEIGTALVLGQYRALHVHFQNGEVYLVSAGDYTLVVASALELQPAALDALAQQAAEQLLPAQPALPHE